MWGVQTSRVCSRVFFFSTLSARLLPSHISSSIIRHRTLGRTLPCLCPRHVLPLVKFRLNERGKSGNSLNRHPRRRTISPTATSYEKTMTTKGAPWKGPRRGPHLASSTTLVLDICAKVRSTSPDQVFPELDFPVPALGSEDS